MWSLCVCYLSMCWNKIWRKQSVASVWWYTMSIMLFYHFPFESLRLKTCSGEDIKLCGDAISNGQSPCRLTEGTKKRGPQQASDSEVVGECLPYRPLLACLLDNARELLLEPAQLTESQSPKLLFFPNRTYKPHQSNIYIYIISVFLSISCLSDACRSFPSTAVQHQLKKLDSQLNCHNLNLTIRLSEPDIKLYCPTGCRLKICPNPWVLTLPLQL